MARYILLKRGGSGSGWGSGSLLTRSFDGGRGGPRLELASHNLEESDVVEARKDPAVLALAPDMPIKLIRPTAAADADAGAEAAWGLGAVGAESSPRTGAGVSVAILDTGIDAAHAAFQHLKWGTREAEQKDFSGSGDGDANGHGTHCAGTIFGRHPDARIGVAPGVGRVLIGKVLDDAGSGGSEMLFNALQWVLQEKANIVSMSLGFDFPGMAADLQKDGWPDKLAVSVAVEAYRRNLRVFDAIMDLFRAMEGFGGAPLVIAASGNESLRDVRPDYRIAASLPSAANGVVAVGAVGRAANGYEVADFSNIQPMVCGPGVEILSARAGGGLSYKSGTSMACPHVAGVAALWWEELRNSQIAPTPRSVLNRLIDSCRRDVFAQAFDEGDLGEGLVTAPQPRV